MRQIKLFALTATLLLGACATTPPADPVAAVAATPEAGSEAEPAARLNCVDETGSRIKPRKGECLNGHGKVYTDDDIRDSGAINAGEVLSRFGAF